MKFWSLVGIVLLSVIAIGIAPSGASPSQYNPNPDPSTTVAVSPSQVGQAHAAPGPTGPLATTGANSSVWVLRGLALVLVGVGFVLVGRRRQYRYRTGRW